MEWFNTALEKLGLLHPEKQVGEYRLQLRAMIRIDALATGSDLKPFPITLEDVNFQGFCFTTKRRVKKGELLLVRVDRPGRHRAAINGRIVWTKKGAKGTQLAGLCYASTDTKTREDWVEFILERTGFAVEELAQKRRNIRIPSVLLVTYQVKDGKEFDATGRDISLGGLLLDTRESFDGDEDLHLVLRSVADGSVLRLGGRVAGVRRAGDGTNLVGVAFHKLSSSTRKMLIHFISEIISRQ